MNKYVVFEIKVGDETIEWTGFESGVPGVIVAAMPCQIKTEFFPASSCWAVYHKDTGKRLIKEHFPTRALATEAAELLRPLVTY